ncbi:MAG: SIS domain-containing protein [Minisyncoccia bacterium]
MVAEYDYRNFGTGTIEQMVKLIQALEIAVKYIAADSIEQLLREIEGANAVFIIGVGRSGEIGRCYAMRETQMDLLYKKIYVAGESTTPASKRGDVAIGVTSSGETDSVNLLLEKFKKKGVRIIVVTAKPDSSAGKMADLIINITDKSRILRDNADFAKEIEKIGTFAPLGTISEIMSLIFFDAFIAEWMKKLNITEDQLKIVHQDF